MIKEASKGVPSWKGQLNIAKQINKKLNLDIPDQVFSDLDISIMDDNNRPKIPKNGSSVLVLDIKLSTPKDTLKSINELMSCRYEECKMNGLLSGNGVLKTFPSNNWRPGLSWKTLDMSEFVGKSTTYIRSSVPASRLPTSSVGWYLFFRLIKKEKTKAPFLKASGFNIDGENPGSIYRDKRTVGFQTFNEKFNIFCPDVDEADEHWINPVLCK